MQTCIKQEADHVEMEIEREELEMRVLVDVTPSYCLVTIRLHGQVCLSQCVPFYVKTPEPLSMPLQP